MARQKSVQSRSSELVDEAKIKLPKNERSWVIYKNALGEKRFILTGTPARDKYILYLIEANGRLTKLGDSKSPMDLEERFDVLEEIRRKNT